MRSFRYSLPGFVGEVSSDTDFEFGKKERYLLEAYVPGIKIMDTDEKPRSRIIHKEKRHATAQVNDGLIELTGEWKGELSSEVYHILGGIARNHYIANKNFPVHAACAGLDDLVLITGHSGSGKTSVSLALYEKHGWRFASGNKTVVEFNGSSMHLKSGTKTMTGKVNDLKKYDDEVIYGNRKAFQLPPDRYVDSGSIGSIVLVRLSDGRREWEEIEGISRLHTLYPFFLDSVNSDVIVSGKAVLDGTSSTAAKEYLVDRLSSSSAPVYKATGPIDHIADRIAEVSR